MCYLCYWQAKKKKKKKEVIQQILLSKATSQKVPLEINVLFISRSFNKSVTGLYSTKMHCEHVKAASK